MPMIRVTGIDQCLKFGDFISGNVTQAIEQVVNQGARDMQQRERSLAPKKTGLLQKSIVTRKGKYGISKMVRAKAPHAPLQEYGTKRGVKGKHFAENTRKELLPGIEAKIRAAVIRQVKS